MRLMRLGDPGSERPFVAVGAGGVVDVSDQVADYDAGFFAAGGIALLSKLIEQDHGRPVVDPTAYRIGAPIAKPYQVVCVGLNYTDHATEASMDVPEEPILFTKSPHTVVGPNDHVLLPPGSEKTDWEVELGLVIGSRARYLEDEAAALGCIAGYTISHDLSERHLQLERGGQWVKGKSAETFNPLGPWLVTPDAVGDPQSLALELAVNGETMQSSTTANMIFSVGYLVWYISQFMVLEPGDLINTGTPAGVALGMDPPRYLAEGDVIELTISELGTQRQEVRRARR